MISSSSSARLPNRHAINEVWSRLSLDKDAPDFRGAQKIGRIAAIPILGGLHHQYVRF